MSVVGDCANLGALTRIGYEYEDLWRLGTDTVRVVNIISIPRIVQRSHSSVAHNIQYKCAHNSL